MDSQRYDVYLTGKLAQGITPAQAAARLAQLFKSTPEAMAGLLSGKPQLLKRGLEHAAALKYREALARAGVEVAFKAQQATAPAPVPPPPTRAAPAPNLQPAAAAGGLSLAPAGSDVLTEQERSHVEAVAVDIGHLSLAPVGPLGEGDSRPAAPAPDVSHLSLAAAGTDLLSDAERAHPPIVEPDTSALSLAPEGTPLDTPPSAAEPLHPDTSALSLAPAGSELLSEEQRRKPAVATPDTSHLRLADSDR